jgi:hypothetical protein
MVLRIVGLTGFLVTQFVFCRATQAQYVLQTVHGNWAGDQLGSSIAGIADQDADGVPDVLVGSPLASDFAGTKFGRVDIISGRSGNRLRVLTGSTDSLFGAAVARIGDLTLDGVDEYIVGAPHDTAAGTQAGAAYVYAGQSGTLLRSYNGAAFDHFGTDVAGVGDVNGDGFPDFIIGAPLDDSVHADGGAAYLYSGRSGSHLRSFFGRNIFDEMGHAVAGAGDLNQDGYPDLLISSPEETFFAPAAGIVRAFDSQTGTVLFTLGGIGINDLFGLALDGGVDCNNDGWPDILVGAPGNAQNGYQAGMAQLLSGRDGSVLRQFWGQESKDQLGAAVALVEDLNGDGKGEVLIGVPGDDQRIENGGSVRLYLGSDGPRLTTLAGRREDALMGQAVAAVGDLDGDGLADLAAGTPEDSVSGTQSGSLRLFTPLPTPKAGDCLIEPEVELSPAGLPGGRFGTQLALDGTALAIAAPYDAQAAPAAGAAYVFRLQSSQWTQEAKITASNTAQSDRFSNNAIALQSDVLVTAAPFSAPNGRAFAGQAYVFRRQGSLWTEETILTSSDSAPQDLFGLSVALDGPVVAVGAIGAGHSGALNAGAVYVFRHNGNQWLEEAKLTASDAAGLNGLGRGLALQGDVLLAGAFGTNDANPNDFYCQSGAVYLFRREGTQWVERQKLTASDAACKNNFGTSIDLDGSRALIGAHRKDNYIGAAYVWSFNGTSFQETHKLVAPGFGGANPNFGGTVALDGDLAVIGAFGWDAQYEGAGSAFLFRFNGTDWIPSGRLGSRKNREHDQMGFAVAAGGGSVVVSANEQDQTAAIDAGVVYLDEVPELSLSASPTETVVGGDVALTTCGGVPGFPTLLMVLDVNGIPCQCVAFGIGTFSSGGSRIVSESALPGISGMQYTLQAIGLDGSFQLVESNRVTVIVH